MGVLLLVLKARDKSMGQDILVLKLIKLIIQLLKHAHLQLRIKDKEPDMILETGRYRTPKQGFRVCLIFCLSLHPSFQINTVFSFLFWRTLRCHDFCRAIVSGVKEDDKKFESIRILIILSVLKLFSVHN